MKSTVTFDQYSPGYAQDWLAISENLRENHPIAWSEAHGGFWIVSRYKDCAKVASDWETFSSENDVNGTGNGGKGVLVPRNPFQFALSESDPPQCLHIRKIETPFLTFQNVTRWETTARSNADEALDMVIETGGIDFVRDYAIPVPARTVMALAGIPDEEWQVFALTAYGSLVPRDHPDYPIDKIQHVQNLMLDLVRQRRQEPQEDVISALVTGQVMGKTMSDEMAIGVLSALVFGGFDTVTTTFCDAMRFLDAYPEYREEIANDQRKLEAAIEEILRLSPPSHSMNRTVVKEVEVHGQILKPGDRIKMLWTAANRDPRVFDRPDEFWLERPNANRHLTFSSGIHRCLGSVFGKMELRIMLETVLRRLPDFKLNHESIRPYETFGGTAGYHAMPATFTSSKKQMPT
jgi:cytochrome P450